MERGGTKRVSFECTILKVGGSRFDRWLTAIVK